VRFNALKTGVLVLNFPPSLQTTAALGGGDVFPRLVVVPAGASASEAISHDGEMKPEAIRAFLEAHAAPLLESEATTDTVYYVYIYIYTYICISIYIYIYTYV